MARPLSWLQRIPEIFRSVEGATRSHYDRPALEKLFQVQPRAAGKLMARLPQVEALGKSRLVERNALLRFIETVREAEDPAAAVAAQAVKVSRKKPKILVRREAVELTKLADLPGSIRIEPGQLTVQFVTLIDLVESLGLLAGALANDAEEVDRRFVALAADGTPRGEKAAMERAEVEALFTELAIAEGAKKPVSGHQNGHHRDATAQSSMN